MAKTFNQESYSFAWAAFAPGTGQTPDTDTEVPVGQAKQITLQVDTTAVGNVSTSTDVNILTSINGTDYDTVAYASLDALADNAVSSIAITPGPNFIKLTADNNDGSNNAAPTAIILVKT